LHCTVNETCQDGKCQGGAPLTCMQTGNACRSTECIEAEGGCVTKTLGDGAKCEGSKTCCSGNCVDINTDENNCGGCGFKCPKPEPQGGGTPAKEMCSFIEYCDDPRSNAVGSVCRNFPDAACKVLGAAGDATASECLSELNTPTCGNKIVPPAWLCNSASTECRLVAVPKR
jgi:hypothetical protein